MNDIIFSELKLTDKYLFKRFTDGYINSESSFTNLMMWKKQYNACYAVVDNTLILKYNLYILYKKNARIIKSKLYIVSCILFGRKMKFLKRVLTEWKQRVTINLAFSKTV